jgi:tRNA(fMet)-specific endonuclease VapC
MLQYLLDTDHVILLLHGYAPVGRRLALQPAGAVGIGAVSVEETLRGRLAQLAHANDGPRRIHFYSLLEGAVLRFAKLPIVPYNQPAEDWFQQLRPVRIGT